MGGDFSGGFCHRERGTEEAEEQGEFVSQCLFCSVLLCVSEKVEFMMM